MREERAVTVRYGNGDNGVTEDKGERSPFSPVCPIPAPFLKRHDRNAEGLYCHDKAVENNAEASNKTAYVEKCRNFSESRQSHADNADDKGDVFGIEPYGTVNKAGKHLFKGQSASWENIIHPCVGIEEFADCVDNKHCSADFAHQLFYFPGNEFFAGDFFHKGDHKDGEHRTGAYGRKKIEEESPRPNEETVAENIGTSEKHAVHAAQTALVECGEERSDTGKKRHIHVEIVGKVLDECIFFK